MCFDFLELGFLFFFLIGFGFPLALQWGYLNSCAVHG